MLTRATMEEAELLRERLQAITVWIVVHAYYHSDGLESWFQSSTGFIPLFHRIEEEVEALENQELNISANEEVVLKRLKEVERTTEDIIKELHADFQPATFAMEISVEHDKRTGKNQVVSTTTIAPGNIQERGSKVFDDGRKSIYALHRDGGDARHEAVGAMTSTEVDELLHQATDKSVPTEVQYHQPVFSLPYTATSRPETPRTPRQTPTPGSSPSVLREESYSSQDLETRTTSKSPPGPSPAHRDAAARVQRQREETKRPYTHIPGESNRDVHGTSRPHVGATTPQGLANRKTDAGKTDAGSPNTAAAALVSVKARSEDIPAPEQASYTGSDGQSPSPAGHKRGVDPEASTRRSGDAVGRSPFCSEGIASLSLNALPEELEAEPVTMIFMGYENAEDEDGDDFQAELVIIDDDEDDDEGAHRGSDGEACVSYHPEGHKSQVFQPKGGTAEVAGCRDANGDTKWEESGLHKPTFSYNPERRGRYLTGRKVDPESENTGGVNVEEMKLCSTGR
ncbi:Palmdelphin [Liparis tanakae]|uniref:Palmdelphin n=1 Tax=Liparis tanakae TaxID=230148 RepID=A0A4Z2H5Z2_9TELE|nr:Palmdelphin [Liparis tanakae]